MSDQARRDGEELWQRFVGAERGFYAARAAVLQARRALIEAGADLPALLSRALESPAERGSALRLLLTLDEPTRRAVLPLLVYLASVVQADIQWVRDVILSLDRAWLAERLPNEVERVLADPTVTYWEYRRLAELLVLAQSPYLAAVREKAAASDDAEIREVAEDYSDPTDDFLDLRAGAHQAADWWPTPPRVRPGH